MRTFIFRFLGAFIAILAGLGISSVSASAQVSANSGTLTQLKSSVQPTAQFAGATTVTAKACTENFFYISGNGVRIRKSPGGTILAHANYWERVIPGQTSGSWTYVNFYQRPPGFVNQGWVASQYVSFHQPTCW